MRLARAHAASVSGDALFAIGLAGSVFFSLDFNKARWHVALYLVLTIAPFAVAAPLIGPAIDRIKGGRRWIIVGSLAARAVLCVLVVRHMDSLLFYPEAFGMLVLQKVYSISKSAVVPGTVHSDAELVEANSKLTVLSALAVVAAAIPGGILLKLGGGGWSVGLGAMVFGVGTVLAFQLTPTTVASEPVGAAEKEELRSAGIVLASSAMAMIRGIVGFLSFMLAFSIKENGALWELGLVAAAAQIGFFFGAIAAPRVRRLATEENILVGALVVTAVMGLVTAMIGGLAGAAILSMTVGATGSAAKQAFDAIVQRDAPDANRGRSFARFETRFQMVWVIGALIPIIVPISAEIGFALIGVVSIGAVVSYLIGQRHIRAGRVPVRRRLSLRRRRAVQGFEVDESLSAADPAPTAPLAPPGPEAAVALHDPTLIDVDPTTAFGSVGSVLGRPDPTATSKPSPAPVNQPGSPATPATSAPTPVDPVRRWMRPSAHTSSSGPTGGAVAPSPPAVPGQLPLPLTGDVVDTVAAADRTTIDVGDGAPRTADERGHRPSPQRGLLFDPEAWDDSTTPPAPDDAAH